MEKQNYKETNWEQKEARDMFVRICITYIAKSGEDKDPIVEKIIPIAKQIVDKAFENYPAEPEEEKAL